MTQLQAVTNAGGNGDHVLQRSADFHSHEITVGVDTESGIAELALHDAGKFLVRGSHGDGRRIAAGNFPGKGGAAEGGDTRL